MNPLETTRGVAGHVLVVDDVEDVRYFLSQALTHHGFSVTSAGTGQGGGWTRWRPPSTRSSRTSSCLTCRATTCSTRSAGSRTPRP